MEVWVMIKGGGSENVSRAEFLLPTATEEEIVDWAADAVKKAGAKACPPYLIGIAIGGFSTPRQQALVCRSLRHCKGNEPRSSKA